MEVYIVQNEIQWDTTQMSGGNVWIQALNPSLISPDELQTAIRLYPLH